MIDVQDLRKNYGPIRAVDGLNFKVDRGEVLGLLGPNGAGKTTTMRIITGYLRPSSGTVEIQDMDINEDPEEIKALIGYLPEFAPFYQDMLAYDYLKYVAGMRGIIGSEAEARIVELAKICGLEGVMHQAFKELSRGYKQRVGLAHALMADPDVLILDEPTSGLDPNQIVDIRSIIREIGKQKTIIFSTHILSEAEATCDRIVILDRGKKVADGTPDKLRSSLKSTHVLHVVLKNAGNQEIHDTISALKTVQNVELPGTLEKSGKDNGLTSVRIHCSENAPDEVYLAIKKKEWIISEYRQEKQGLESIFRALTQGATNES